MESSAPWVPSQGPQPLHFQRQALPTALNPPRAHTFGCSPSLSSRSFTSPCDLFQLWVFPFHLEDSQILIGASVTELGDPDPDSVLRILLLERDTQGRHKAGRDSRVRGWGARLSPKPSVGFADYSLSNRYVSQGSE